MSGRYGIGRIVDSCEFPRLQSKLENLYDCYNYNSNDRNVEKCCEIIEQNANVQRKLYDSLTDIAAEDPCRPVNCIVKKTFTPCIEKTYDCYPSYSSSITAATSAAAAAADCAVYSALSRKNAEIADLQYKYERELDDLESELCNTRLDKCELSNELESAKKELECEKRRARSLSMAQLNDINDLKAKLRCAELKLACCEPKASLAKELEKQICDLKDEIRCVRAKNAILNDQNEFQARIIRSRASSPACITTCVTTSPPCNTTCVTVCRSRTPSPCRPISPCRPRSPCVTILPCRPRSPCVPRSPSPCIRRRSYSSCSITVKATSPLSPNHCTQVIRQEALINRFNDLYCRDRCWAMDILKNYSCDCENKQRIIFAAVQEAFTVAKRAFCDWKSKVRSTVCRTHCGPETLEEAVQNYINRNVDLYDLPCMVSEVICGLNRHPKISLPAGVSYSVISSFIREACRIAWQMTCLAYPLDTVFALDAECLDETKYRRSFDSEYTAPLVNHHVWPCLIQCGKVIAKGEACTKRGASLNARQRLNSFYNHCPNSGSQTPICLRSRSVSRSASRSRPVSPYFNC